MKKVLILVESLKIGGGSERFAAALGSALSDYGYEISYLTLMDDKPKYKFKGRYYTLDIDDIYANGFKRLIDLIKYAPRIKKLCDDREIETIIAVSEVANFYAVLSRWMFKNGVRIIATQHMNPEIFLDDKLKFFSIKFFYQRADEVVCVSRESENALNNIYNIPHTRTIYNMMNMRKNIKLSQNELPTEYKKLFNGNYFKFINIARLTKQKGQWFMIRSFKKVVDQHPSSRLFILGDGPLRKDLESLISSLNLKKHVFLLGEQDNVFNFLKNSDCFIFPSLWEGLPLVLIEALSTNIPLISADCKTGPREILTPEISLSEKIEYPYQGEYGILSGIFPQEIILKDLKEVPLLESEKHLTQSMIEMMENKDLRMKYSQGMNRAQDFEEKNIIKEWNAVIEYVENLD